MKSTTTAILFTIFVASALAVNKKPTSYLSSTTSLGSTNSATAPKYVPPTNKLCRGFEGKEL